MISRSLSDVEAVGGTTCNGLGPDSGTRPEVEGASSALGWGCSDAESIVTGVSWTGRKDESFSASRADAFSRKAVAEEVGSETTSLAASFRRRDEGTHGNRKRSRREMKDMRGEDGDLLALCLAADFGEGGCSTAVDEWAPSEAVCAPFRETRVGWVPVRVVERDPLSLSFSRSGSSVVGSEAAGAEGVELPGNDATVVEEVVASWVGAWLVGTCEAVGVDSCWGLALALEVAE
jgi:hypothetical protein